MDTAMGMATVTAMGMAITKINNCKCMKQILPCFLVLMAAMWPVTSSSQTYSIYNNTEFDPITRELYNPGLNVHTSVRPYRMDQLNKHLNTDSILYRGIVPRGGHQNIWRRFLHADLFKWEEKGDNPITVRINPLFNFELGKDQKDAAGTWVNTRGIMVEGQLGKNLSFYGDLHENQGVYPSYLHDFIEKRGVVPGQGRAKRFGDNGYDFSQSTGYLSYNTGPWINLQLGYGKNFIGDGHRSLLLSDNTFSYPYLKMNTSFWKVNYMVMVSQFNHLENTFRGGDERFEYKYGVFHYLTLNLGKRVSFGIFESVIWAAEDETGHRGIDLSYLVPVVVYRPVEYALGSPDNVTMGANLKVILWPGAAFYGQFVMGEFKQDEVFKGTKWWANKQGFQTGLKAYNFLGIQNLDVQTEYNQVRPYTYSHYYPLTNYGHFNQELAHPLGSSFRENVSFVRYRKGRWHINLETMYAIHGKDYGDGVSWGGDIFMPSVDRPFSHGHEIAQGLRTTIKHAAGSLSYLINPKNNMNISVGMRNRSETNSEYTHNNQHLWVSLRTSLSNFYYNF